eukprot:5000554-Pleurochrysis_carterae.AAC.2
MQRRQRDKKLARDGALDTHDRPLRALGVPLRLARTRRVSFLPMATVPQEHAVEAVPRPAFVRFERSHRQPLVPPSIEMLADALRVVPAAAAVRPALLVDLTSVPKKLQRRRRQPTCVLLHPVAPLMPLVPVFELARPNRTYTVLISHSGEVVVEPALADPDANEPKENEQQQKVVDPEEDEAGDRARRPEHCQLGAVLIRQLHVVLVVLFVLGRSGVEERRVDASHNKPSWPRVAIDGGQHRRDPHCEQDALLHCRWHLQREDQKNHRGRHKDPDDEVGGVMKDVVYPMCLKGNDRSGDDPK